MRGPMQACQRLGGGDMFKNLDTREQMAERGNEKSMVEVEEFRDSSSRKRWVFIVYLLTFFIPDFLIRWLGRMTRKDVRMAWREKLAINMIIWFTCCVAVCPHQYVFSADELSSNNGQNGAGAYAAVRGPSVRHRRLCALALPLLPPD